MKSRYRNFKKRRKPVELESRKQLRGKLRDRELRVQKYDISEVQFRLGSKVHFVIHKDLFYLKY